MSEKNNGGPAFPSEQHETQNGEWNQTFGSGMTLRDYFAAKAMQVVWEAYDKGYSAVDPDNFDSAAMAKHAYQIADAMIRAREGE